MVKLWPVSMLGPVIEVLDGDMYVCRWNQGRVGVYKWESTQSTFRWSHDVNLTSVEDSMDSSIAMGIPLGVGVMWLHSEHQFRMFRRHRD